MKKVLFYTAVFFAAVTFVACGKSEKTEKIDETEQYVQNFEEACAAKNMQAVDSLDNLYGRMRDNMSQEQKARYEKALYSTRDYSSPRKSH